MQVLDLFNTRYERQLQEGGVDNLEARRIDDLNMRMLELLDRAKEPAYKKNPAALAGLKKQFQKIKSERDSYFKINPATGMNDTGTLGTVKGALDELGIPGNIPTEKIPGKEDLLKGRGRTYYEGAEDYADIYSPEAIALGKRFCEHYNITDDIDVQFAVEIIDSYLDEFKATGEPVDLKKIKSGVANAFRQAHRGLGVAGPNFRKKFQEDQKKSSDPVAEQSAQFKQGSKSIVDTGAPNQRAIGNANMALLMKANAMPNNYPALSLTFSGGATEKLDKTQIEIISDYYDGLADDNQRNHFIYNILSNRDQVIALMSKLGAPISVQKELPLQGELPLSEKKRTNDQPDLTASTASDVKVARELQKLRAKYPGAKSDLEALARSEIDTSERSAQQLDAIRGANEKQDVLLKQLVALDREQGEEINNLDQENNSLEKQLANVQATNDRLQQTLSQMTGTKKLAKARKPADKDTDTAEPISIAPTIAVDQPAPEPVTKPATKPKSKSKVNPKQVSQPKTLPAKAFGQMAQQFVRPTKLSADPAPPQRLRVPANEPMAQDAAESANTGKVKEGKEIHSKEDFVRERDRLLRMISQETNPANKQILKSSIRQLENRAENEGWITIQSRMVKQ
jgi:hypothetical protein